LVLRHLVAARITSKVRLHITPHDLSWPHGSIHSRLHITPHASKIRSCPWNVNERDSICNIQKYIQEI
jgi:hypothetical protein